MPDHVNSAIAACLQAVCAQMSRWDWVPIASWAYVMAVILILLLGLFDVRIQ